MRSIRCSSTVVLALACSLNGMPQDSTRAGVDTYVNSEIARQRIPGLALGVYRDGKIIKAQGYGLANIELNVPVKPETIFQSGSVGKQFTATGIMMLVEEGKIGLDDSVRKYFPEAPATWQNIQIRNLLSHTSGLAEYESEEKTKPGGPINMRADYTENEMVKIIESFPMDFQPGEKWAYRNTNYVLLGVMIHKVSGKFYGDFLQERIFKPLGMNSTRVISDADIIPNRAAGYQLVKGELKNQDWVSPFFNSTADGALYFNILDIAKWDEALYTENLLKKASFDVMWSPFKLNDGKVNRANYGFAWSINNVNGHRVIEHGGAWQGFTTYIARYLDDRFTVVVLTNLDSGHANPEKIAHHVAGLYDAAFMPPELKPIPDSEPQVTARLRGLLDKIAAGQADPNDFAPDYRAQLFPDQMKSIGDGLKRMAPMKSCDLLERKTEGEQRLYTYRLATAENTFTVKFALDADNRVAAMDFSKD